jgi:hypothetical protein
VSDSDVLGVILSRLNHQDKTLDEIKGNQAELRGKLDTHMQLEAEVKPSIDELIAVLNGSKLIGRLVIWMCSIAGAVWAVVAWARNHIDVKL